MSLIERWENDDEPEFIIRNGHDYRLWAAGNSKADC